MEVAIRNRALTLRSLGPADVDGLEQLYRSLSPQDRYQRFFSEAIPRRATVERYVALVDQHGAGLVALTDTGAVAGEAGYFRRPGGEGEFGITVASEWHGLGHVLLESIIDQSAAAGLSSLQADVLAENRSMLALAAKRGFALVHIPDYTVVRIALGTATAVPAWPADTARPRLLVEAGGWRWRAASEASAAGFQIMSCRGPSSLPDGRCPALHGGSCPLVEGADAIIVALHPDDPNRGALTPIHRFCNPDVPVFVQQAAGEEPPAWIPSGVGTLRANASPADIVARLQKVVAGPGGRPRERVLRPEEAPRTAPR